jgi:hypothetical protein
MPPKNATAAAARRKGPSFNPPRPVGAPSKATATKRVPAASRTTAAAKKSNAPAAKSGFQNAKDIIDLGLDLDLSDDSQNAPISDDDLDISDIDMDDVIEDAPIAPSKPPPPLSEPVVPRALLARLLLENFDDPNMQIQTGAMKLVGKYIDIFVTEAFLRSKEERRTAAKGGGGIEGISDGFLQVEDLERLAPQLVLDF